MTTTEQIQALNDAVNSLTTQVNTISGQLSTQTNNLNLHLVDCDNSITTIQGRLGVLSNEDIEIHQEIHEVSIDVDNNTSRINNLEVDSVSQASRLTDLEQADIDFQEQLEDMDEEHHEELHRLALAIDNSTSRINSLEIFKAGVPNHVVMSEEAYNELSSKDYDTFYFTYEED